MTLISSEVSHSKNFLRMQLEKSFVRIIHGKQRLRNKEDFYWRHYFHDWLLQGLPVFVNDNSECIALNKQNFHLLLFRRCNETMVGKYHWSSVWPSAVCSIQLVHVLRNVEKESCYRAMVSAFIWKVLWISWFKNPSTHTVSSIVLFAL